MIKEFYPDLYDGFASRFTGDESLISGEKAFRRFGYQPQKTWGDILAATKA